MSPAPSTLPLSPAASTLPLSSASSDREESEQGRKKAGKAQRLDLFGACDWEQKGSLNDPYQPRDSLGIGSESDILNVGSSREMSGNGQEATIGKEKESETMESGGGLKEGKKE